MNVNTQIFRVSKDRVIDTIPILEIESDLILKPTDNSTDESTKISIEQKDLDNYDFFENLRRSQEMEEKRIYKRFYKVKYSSKTPKLVKIDKKLIIDAILRYKVKKFFKEQNLI